MIAEAKVDDVVKRFKEELASQHIYASGHELRQGTHYVEIRNALFVCDKDCIIDAPEYEELADGSWYEHNYLPKINSQVEIAASKLIDDSDSRQAILCFYHPASELLGNDMICTIYVSLRLDEEMRLHYTVHMRSSDAREYRSDIKFHKLLQSQIVTYLQLSHIDAKPGPIVWYADSLQLWDKDWHCLEEV